jgi:hypothetical protein
MTSVKGIKKLENNCEPTLDIGSHINAGHQARRVAAARHERRLFAVACMPMLGKVER